MEQVSPCSSDGVEVGGHDGVRVEGAGVCDQQGGSGPAQSAGLGEGGHARQTEEVGGA